MDVSQRIMRFLPPQDLLNFVKSSKRMLEHLTMDIAVMSSLFYGKHPYQSAKNLHPHMLKRSIYPLNALRVLMILAGSTCEFCRFYYNNEKNKTTCVRPNFGTKICWYCVKGEAKSGMILCGRDNIPPMTSAFYKLIAYPYKPEYYLNQFYIANRDILYKIFEHPRVLSYPYGVRFFSYDEEEGVMTPANNGEFISYDQMEIMWKKETKDGFGNMTGPLLPRSKLNELVKYMKTTDGSNEDIDHFLDNKIRNPPSVQDYQPFLDAYDRYIQRATEREESRKRIQASKKHIRHYKKIEMAVDMMSLIISEFTIENISKWNNETGRVFLRRYSKELQAEAFTRLLLLYEEAPFLAAEYFIKFRSGNASLDVSLHDVLGKYLKKPSMFKEEMAEQTAHLLYKKCRFELMKRCNSMIYNDNGRLDRCRVRTDFPTGTVYTGARRRSLRRNRFEPWTDTSAKRHL